MFDINIIFFINKKRTIGWKTKMRKKSLSIIIVVWLGISLGIVLGVKYFAEKRIEKMEQLDSD